MSLDHAILGFLNYKPMSGYDLKSVFDLSVKHFWPAEQSQIYRTLSRLSEQGFTNIEVVRQEDRPDRKVYHITDFGREELHKWLISDLPCCGERIASLIQIFFAGGLSDEEILGLLNGLAQKAKQVLKHFSEIQNNSESESETEGAPKRDSFFWWLTLDYGIYMTQAYLKWVEDVIAIVERGEHANYDPPALIHFEKGADQ